MKISVVSFGHGRGDIFLPAAQDYLKRIIKPWSVGLVDLPTARQSDRENAQSVMAKEAATLVANKIGGLHSWALAAEGKSYNSEGFSQLLNEASSSGVKQLHLVIGGADGLEREWLSKAERRLSLSAMTFPHRLVRLLLCEQIYRAQCIVRGDPYHK